MRHDGRRTRQLREATMRRGVNAFAEGSCFIQMGMTELLVTASVEQRLPGWLKGSGKGWVTAEYGMLPRANRQRNQRERMRASGRTQEIQRLVGRSLRAVVDLTLLPEIQVVLDCDVIQADGGTRCAAVSAAYVALSDALSWCRDKGLVKKSPLLDSVAAVSAGIVGGKPVLDLDYREDSSAEVDGNFVITGKGRLVEVQLTGEEATFDQEEMIALLDLARFGAGKIRALQRRVLRA